MGWRFSAILLFAAGAGFFVWNAWFREQSIGDAVVGDAYMILYASVALALASLFVMLFPRYRPQDRYWAYLTLGMVLGFWLQR